jgi:hypothetical protein
VDLDLVSLVDVNLDEGEKVEVISSHVREAHVFFE